ncbi:MAG: formate--tetrahydrofolate ligase [Clostridiales bacterium]|jgi:formate--tetrahydrofolate ligase|nr:formate--tetrahydrofolate ligase [Clostridiales bacterium]
MLSDIEIAESVKLKPISEVAAEIGISDDELYPYGRHIAKVIPRAEPHCTPGIIAENSGSKEIQYASCENARRTSGAAEPHCTPGIIAENGGSKEIQNASCENARRTSDAAEPHYAPGIIAENGGSKEIQNASCENARRTSDAAEPHCTLGIIAENNQKTGKLILVTAINPTKSGEGKTTVSIGLADAMRRLGKKVALALREPSLGPVFGIKGGAAGGGYSQIAPMADINLHFTGDFNAIEKANNLLCAAIDNNIYFKTDVKLDPERIIFKRCIDMNDRSLRNIQLMSADGEIFRRDGFNITAASEIMAVFCLSKDFADLKKRLSEIVVGYDADGRLVKCGQLGCADAMAVLLKNAVFPNLVQTLEGTPAFVHGGPFANIAHGCNSIIATKEALKRADYVVTEAGFGADLGAEKFIDVKSRIGGFDIACTVVVATVRALKLNGGAKYEDLAAEDLTALDRGMPNLLRHIENLKKVFNLPVTVALNSFFSDTERETAAVKAACAAAGAEAFVSECFRKGGAGSVELAGHIIKTADSEPEKGSLCRESTEDNAGHIVKTADSPKGRQNFCYELTDGYTEKLSKIAEKIYRAKGVVLSEKAKKQLFEIEEAGYTGLPVCVAKTQYSFSDNPALLGAPEGFDLFVNGIELRAGAGFVVALCGNMILMPALSRSPGYERMSVSGDGTIRGLS